MNQLQTNLNNNLTDTLLNYIWRNWCALGVSSNLEPANKVIIDPEALLLLTCSIGRCDQRLFDEVTDWLTTNWELINISRLKNMLKLYPWSGERVIPPLAAWLIEHQGKLTKWKGMAGLPEKKTPAIPFFMDRDGIEIPIFGELEPIFLQYGFSRGKISLRGYSRSFKKENPSCLLLSLRSFFGTNVRAEIIAYLLTYPEGAHPSGIANTISYYQKTAHNALTTMKKSQWVNCHETGFEKIYSLVPALSESFLGRNNESLKWMNLPPIYCLMEKVWEKLNDQEFLTLSSGVQSIELREAIAPVAKRIKHPLFSQILSNQIKGEDLYNSLITAINNFIK